MKINAIILSVIILITCFMFSGCDTWNYDGKGTMPPITDGTHMKDPNNDPNHKPSDEDHFGKDDMIDDSMMYDFLDGVKLCFDGRRDKIRMINDSKFELFFAKIANYINSHNSIDCEDFSKNNLLLGLNPQQISSIVWLYNYVNQYTTLANLILTEISENYGFGVGDNFVLNNGLYGKISYSAFDIPNSTDYKSNYNIINLGVLETNNKISTINPYLNKGDAIFNKDGLQINFNIVDNIDFALDKKIPTKAYSFKMNLGNDLSIINFEINNPYFDPQNIVNQKNIKNPEYSESNSSVPEYLPNPKYISEHILGMEKLNLVGAIDGDNNIVYTINGENKGEALAKNTFINEYIKKYSMYLGLKLLETNLKFQNGYNGEYSNVNYSNFFALYRLWDRDITRIGFFDKYTIEDIEYNTLDEFATCVLNEVVGEKVLNFDKNSTEYSRDLSNNITQIVKDCLNMKVKKNDKNFIIDLINGQQYFQTINNLEWKDYKLDEIKKPAPSKEEKSNLYFSNSRVNVEGPKLPSGDDYDDNYIAFPDEKIYSVVFMLKKDFEPVVFQSLLLLMLAPINEIDVDMYFRYVKDGKDLIFDKIDYSLKQTNNSNDESDVVINSDFSGHLDKYSGGDISMEENDKNLFALEDFNTPKLSTIKNKEILIEEFVNNMPSSFCQSLNATHDCSKYAYKDEYKTYYYNEKSDNCDYVEINFNLTNKVKGANIMRLILYDMYFIKLSELKKQ